MNKQSKLQNINKDEAANASIPEDIQIELEKSIEPSLKSDIELVQEELKTLSNGKEFKTFDTINPELVKKLCEENNIVVYPQFKDAVNTPFAIAKYLDLKAEAENLANEIDFDISTFVDKEKVEWVVHKDLTNEITFSKKIDDKNNVPQCLIVKFRKDALTGKTIYSIKSNNWCWDISKTNLKALVESGELIKDIPNGITNLKPTIKALSDNEFVFEIGNAFTITCKNS